MTEAEIVWTRPPEEFVFLREGLAVLDAPSGCPKYADERVLVAAYENLPPDAPTYFATAEGEEKCWQRRVWILHPEDVGNVGLNYTDDEGSVACAPTEAVLATSVREGEPSVRMDDFLRENGPVKVAERILERGRRGIWS